MSQQDGFGNNSTQPTGSSEPDNDDDGMQRKSENVAHAPDGIKPNKLRIRGTCGIRHRGCKSDQRWNAGLGFWGPEGPLLQVHLVFRYNEQFRIEAEHIFSVDRQRWLYGSYSYHVVYQLLFSSLFSASRVISVRFVTVNT
jgi:hypothetical protein